jgi:phage terminase large subunit-like protein
MSTQAHKQKDKEAQKRYDELVKLIQSRQSFVNPLETELEKKKRIESLKKDFKAMVKYYFPEYAESETPSFHVKHANRMLKNKRIRVWTMWPRGHAKSVVNNLLIPFWLWMNKETRFFLIIGENQDKAELLLDDLRAEFEANEMIINDFGVQKTLGDWSSGSFRTKNGFIGKALGMGQSPRGIRVKNKRPDLIGGDDWENEQTVKNPKRQKALAKWFLGSICGTMDVGNRRITISQNKFADQMIFDLVTQENDSWIIDKVIAFDPATLETIAWKEKYDRQHWVDVVKEMTMVIALAEYCHQPFVEGAEFKDEMIQWTKLPPLNKMDAIVGIWDPAHSASPTADFNAVRLWGTMNGDKYLIDCYVKRSRKKGALRWIAEVQKRCSVNVLFRYESQFWNEDLQRDIKEIEEEVGYALNLVKMERSTEQKLSRIIATLLPQYTNGRVYYNIQLKSHNDTQEGLKQLKGIEPGYTGKDDAPDADSYAFKELDRSFSHKQSTHKTGKAESRKY